MQTICKEMSIGQVLMIDPETAPIMTEFGMHCLGWLSYVTNGKP